MSDGNLPRMKSVSAVSDAEAIKAMIVPTSLERGLETIRPGIREVFCDGDRRVKLRQMHSSF